MWTDLNKRLKSFTPISLSQLNASASFLDRIDTKYLMTESEFEKILSDLEEDFFILEINDKSVFEYESIYMDTPDYAFYNQHQSKEKNRTKVRTRLYVDSNIAFFEFKQKHNKVTRKFRYQFNPELHGKMGPEATKFFEWVYQSMYGKMPEKISPSIITRYSRLTFCSKKNDERVTVDFNVRVLDARNTKSEEIPFKNLVIVESKSASTNGKSHQIMKDHKIKQAASCSKYSLGLVYHKKVKETSTFDKTVKRLEKIAIAQ